MAADRGTSIRVLSDLHREFHPFNPIPCDADVVVLAGDIDHGTKGLEWSRAAFPHQPIVYVAGNHEYYGEAIPRLTDALRERALQLDVTFLENDSADIGGVRFLGCTLWTDQRLFGAHEWVFDAVRNAMMDYRNIRVSPAFRRLQPSDTAGAHRRSLHWLRQRVQESALPTVIVTHHAPSARSIAPQFASDVVSAAYASHLDEFVETCGATLWVHGHTHHGVDYHIGRTRVVSNQLGYRDQELGFDESLVITVGGSTSEDRR